MTKFKSFLLLIVLFSSVVFAQDKVVQHIVKQGETVTQIALKYKVTPLNIYKLNPDAQNGIKADMTLLIPSTKKNLVETKLNKAEVKSNQVTIPKTHTVTTKETLYGLAKMYNTTVEAIENANPTVAESGIKIGETIVIPSKNTIAAVKKVSVTTTNIIKPIVTKHNSFLLHTVLPKETKYAIAKKYNISVEVLEKANPEIIEGIKIDSQIKIPVNVAKQTIIKSKKSTENDNVVKKNAKIEYLDYIIKAKETMYSLSNKFGLTIAELSAMNPELSGGVKEGMTIKYPSSVTLKENENKIFTDLLINTKSQNKRKLVFLLPFNINKVATDSVNTIATKLKTDKFLNMTLDFYSGVLVAIDSAKTLNIDLDIKILDSQETKNSSNISNLITQNSLSNADVIIGPFYQSNAEKVASLLENSKTIIISPLSKESSSSFTNLITANPNPEQLKEAMFDFMKTKNGNIIAVLDNKKMANKEFIQKKYNSVKLLELNEKNTFTIDNLTLILDKSKLNYVILDSENTSLILKTLNSLISLQKDYEIQLVVLDKNETLDFEEIALSKLTKLKMLFPSITRENKSESNYIFERNYKQKNKITPNVFATRGFDLTFDTILRLSQEKTFLDTVKEWSSEQSENKFEYEPIIGGGYLNKGIYILEYQEDLTVKEAK